MPNHITNYVEFKGVDIDLEDVKTLIDSKTSEFDFNKIIPRPDDITEVASWNKENWGTKRNAYDISWPHDHIVTFHTAWTTPLPLFEALGKLFPEVVISVYYADEDLGQNCGKIVVINDIVKNHDISGTPEGSKFAYIISRGITSFEEMYGNNSFYEDEKTLREVYGEEHIKQLKETFEVNTHLTKMAEYIVSD